MLARWDSQGLASQQVSLEEGGGGAGQERAPSSSLPQWEGEEGAEHFSQWGEGEDLGFVWSDDSLR